MPDPRPFAPERNPLAHSIAIDATPGAVAGAGRGNVERYGAALLRLIAAAG